jgi:hypothetical protein
MTVLLFGAHSIAGAICNALSRVKYMGAFITSRTGVDYIVIAKQFASLTN